MCFRNQPWTPAFLWDALKENRPYKNHWNPWWRGNLTGFFSFLQMDLSVCVLCVSFQTFQFCLHGPLPFKTLSTHYLEPSWKGSLSMHEVKIVKVILRLKEKKKRNFPSNSSEIETKSLGFKADIDEAGRWKRLRFVFAPLHTCSNKFTYTSYGTGVETRNAAAAWQNKHGGHVETEQTWTSCTSASKSSEETGVHQLYLH